MRYTVFVFVCNQMFWLSKSLDMKRIVLSMCYMLVFFFFFIFKCLTIFAIESKINFPLHCFLYSRFVYFFGFRVSLLPVLSVNMATKLKLNLPKPVNVLWCYVTIYRKWIHRSSIKLRIWPNWPASMRRPSCTTSKTDTILVWFT